MSTQKVQLSRVPFFSRMVLFLLTNLGVILLLGFVLRVLGVEQLLAARGLPFQLGGLLVFAAVLGFAGSIVSLLMSKRMALWGTGARVIGAPRSPTERWLVETVHRQADAAGIGRPDVAVYDSPDPNAFATGANRDAALVAVSTGLLRGMGKREVQAVLAHEVSHVANGDMITLALMQGVVNTFVIFLSRVVGFAVDKLVFRTERGIGPGYWITVIVLEMALGLVASMLVMAFSRHREYRADAGAAVLEGPDAMIRALQALKAPRELPADLPQNIAAFGIRGGRRGLAALLSSHPPLDARIAALERTRGGGAPAAGRPGR